MSVEGRAPAGLKDEFAEKWRRLYPRERKFYSRGAPATQKQWIFRQYWAFIERRLPVRAGGLLCLGGGAGWGTTSLYLTAGGPPCVLVGAPRAAFGTARNNFAFEGIGGDLGQTAPAWLSLRHASVA